MNPARATPAAPRPSASLLSSRARSKVCFSGWPTSTRADGRAAAAASARAEPRWHRREPCVIDVEAEEEEGGGDEPTGRSRTRRAAGGRSICDGGGVAADGTPRDRGAAMIPAGAPSGGQGEGVWGEGGGDVRGGCGADASPLARSAVARRADGPARGPSVMHARRSSRSDHSHAGAPRPLPHPSLPPLPPRLTPALSPPLSRAGELVFPPSPPSSSTSSASSTPRSPPRGPRRLDVFDMARVDDSMITPSRDPGSHTASPIYRRASTTSRWAPSDRSSDDPEYLRHRRRCAPATASRAARGIHRRSAPA